MSAMPAEKITTECPACHRHSLVKHCENRRCTWAQCRNQETCDLVYDVRTGHGHMLGPVAPGMSARGRVRWARETQS